MGTAGPGKPPGPRRVVLAVRYLAQCQARRAGTERCRPTNLIHWSAGAARWATMADVARKRPLQAHHLGLGKLYRRLGRLDEARAEPSTAITMLREMGMALWLPEAE